MGRFELAVPDSVRRAVRARYPRADIRWNPLRQEYEVGEVIPEGARSRWRRVFGYRNDDNSKAPLIADRVIKKLQLCDITLWPLADRMALYDKDDAKEEDAALQAVRRHVEDHIREDYHYIAGIPTFFFGPDMQVGKAGLRPSQQRALAAMNRMG